MTSWKKLIMGKCKFNEGWLDSVHYRKWLKPVVGNICEAYCTMCKKKIQLGTMGVKALDSHAKSVKHANNAQAMEKTLPITARFPPANGAKEPVASTSRPTATAPPPEANFSQPAADAPPAPPPATAAARVDLRTSFGSTPTLKAEVLWTLHTISKHHSYNGNEGVSALFKCMFPDSDIANSFSCGADKTAYIAKFGLAVYIKEELVSKVNKSPFVLMFDESLNQTTKNKQLDVHVRFWDEGQVQSRYLGSEFMGHSTAKDLLSHLKVSTINHTHNDRQTHTCTDCPTYARVDCSSHFCFVSFI